MMLSHWKCSQQQVVKVTPAEAQCQERGAVNKLKADCDGRIPVNGKKQEPQTCACGSWLGDRDSNPDSQIQSLMSCQLDDPPLTADPATACILPRGGSMRQYKQKRHLKQARSGCFMASNLL
jgi:hypothetical protein